MNLAQKSAVNDLPHTDEECSALQTICRHTNHVHENDTATGKWSDYKKVLLKVRINY